MTGPSSTSADPQQIIADLQRQIAELTAERDEAIAQQTATAEVLGVINSSPGDLAPVFDAMLEKALRLCDATFGTLFTRDGDVGRLVAWRNVPDAFAEYLTRDPMKLRTILGPDFRNGPVIHIEDLAASAPYRDGIPLAVAAVDLGGIRSMLVVPLMKDGILIGLFAIYGHDVRPFTDKQIALLQNFAAQAVIAMENARLFNETREALARQTATADVLKVIASSPSNLQPVFDAIAERSNKLIRGHSTTVFRFIGNTVELAAFTPINEKADAVLRAAFPRQVSMIAGFDSVLCGDVVETIDATSDTEPEMSRVIARARGFRSRLIIPLKGDSSVIGAISITRSEPGEFADKDKELLSTFADQAVIAIQNVKLFEEVQARTRDLEESLQQQTATSEVLQIISSSPGDLAPVFNKMLENATRVCGAGFGSMVLIEGGDMMRSAALYNAPPELVAARANWSFRINPQSSIGMAVREKRVIQTEDLRQSAAYLEGNSSTVELAELGGARTIVVVPMLREDDVIGVITVYRQEVRPFSDKQIDLLTNFARQAVIAIENARLLRELRQRTADLSKSLEDLHTAQGRLIQTEKLASLGQLTAGIAHEIKNPLNFVNNFSALSAELVDEMTEVFENPSLDETGRRKELDEIRELLKGNLEKVVQHGKRADSIVKNMLLHSREGSGERRASNLNALVSESLNLAYHGARAERSDFNITLEQHLDPDAGAVEVYPQELIRALLNLISNGFYAAVRRKMDGGGATFEPVLSAATRNAGEAVEIRIRDNGTGIPAEIKEKIFNPFFTTKPTGEGTGLGLSMTHDIIVKQHGGTIDVETKLGEFTEFIVTLPRGNGNTDGLKSE